MGRAIGVGPAAAVAVAETKRQFGTLLVGRRRGDPVFAAADIAAIEAFAASAAVALALGEAREDLERLSIVEEHDRIARDLHDTVIQRLFATGMGLAAVQGLVEEPVAGRIGQAVEDLDDTIREIRSTIFDLQQSAGDSGGLRRQVRALVADAGARLGFTPRLAFDGPVDTMVPAEVIGHLLPVVREALSNVVRHAQAGAVDVILSLVGSDLVLTIGDDGIGPADGIGPPDGPRTGDGLRNMASRADQLDGRFTLGPRDPRGTVVEWRVPIR
jgi:signal transduction histidine kinase